MTRRPVPAAALTTAIAMLAILNTGCGGTRPSAISSSPEPLCSSGTGLGPAGRPLSSEEEQDAQARVTADRVIAQLAGTWRVLDVGPISGTCGSRSEQLLGVAVRVTFDEREDVTWDEDEIVCVDDKAQRTRFEHRWSAIRGAVALVSLPGGAISWSPVPPPPDDPPPKLVRVKRSVLGPPSGPCPRRVSSD